MKPEKNRNNTFKFQIQVPREFKSLKYMMAKAKIKIREKTQNAEREFDHPVCYQIKLIVIYNTN